MSRNDFMVDLHRFKIINNEKKVLLKRTGGNDTIRNGGGKVIFDNVSSSDNFNINGTTYKISSSKLVKK